jgi:hypothetical protein
MKINGIMIDCSRLLESKKYYYRLIDFMADWGMNTLVLHFSDDQGCAVQLPGFKHLAMPRAFKPQEIKKLIHYAHTKKIDIIPELETFGHANYITGNPEYSSLSAGNKSGQKGHNVLDPLDRRSRELIQKMLKAVVSLFPSKYLHIGCDEVALEAYCNTKNLNVSDVWTDYVNDIIQFTFDLGKIPMLWGDHITKQKQILKKIRKDAVLIDWRYDTAVKDTVLGKLQKAGFKHLIVAPSVAGPRSWLLSDVDHLKNTAKMAAFANKHKILGLINTIWVPWSYLQNAVYYGIAYSAVAVRKGGAPDMDSFNRLFAKKTFGVKLTPRLKQFFENWHKIVLFGWIPSKIVRRTYKVDDKQFKTLLSINKYASKTLSASEYIAVKKNKDIYNGMLLSAKCAWVCSEFLLLKNSASARQNRKVQYNNFLNFLCADMQKEWDKTRYPADEQNVRKNFEKPALKFGGYGMLLVNLLPKISLK